MKATSFPLARRTLKKLLPALVVSLTCTHTFGQTKSVARKWNEALMEGIRRNVPNPPAHARNLFHTAAAMFDAWAAYDPGCVGYLKGEKVSPLPGTPAEIETARNEAVSYAAYTVIRNRFFSGTGSTLTLADIDALMTSLGYSPALARSTTTSGATPAMMGKRCGDRTLVWGSQDGFNNLNYPEPYTNLLNPNLDYPMSAMGTNSFGVPDQPLGAGIPFNTDPNFWQPLALSSSITQNGITIPGGIQDFIGKQSLATTPFSLTRTNPTRPWLDPFGGPSKLSVPFQPSETNQTARDAIVDVLVKSSKLNSTTQIDISPGAIGNNPLGTDSGTGYAANPITAAPFAPVNVAEGDYARVLAEFWADGPRSETPPGHWHVIANEIADSPSLQKRIEGTGPVVNDLEWDVKVYFALSSALHDAASAAWALKRYYSGARPITQIRWAAEKGQSSNSGPGSTRFSEYGLPLIPGVIEQITWDTVQGSGGQDARHAYIQDMQMNQEVYGGSYIGRIVVKSWPGEHPSNPAPGAPAIYKNPVKWMLARDWLPFQRKSFNTPAFPGYVSGHSTFSRAGAEVLTKITGSPWFPGGYHSHTIAANSLQIDLGPATPVKLGWASYYDAADQAGQSRRWGGIHVSEDDYHGRVIGATVGVKAYALASSYWKATIDDQILPVNISVLANGSRKLTWSAIRGMYHRVQSSTELNGPWTNETVDSVTYDPAGTWTDDSSFGSRKFYRVVVNSQP